MDTDTIQRLNAVNQAFYAAVAQEFDATRGAAWRGWARLMPYAQALDRARSAPTMRVLDVGCGNGRLGVFLAQNLEGRIAYHGMDSSAALLERAREALAPIPHLDARLEERDIVENPPDGREYDLIALFGVLHHVPGVETRLRLMRTLAAQVAPGGILAFACWRFYEYERFRERIIPFPADLRVEPNDYLLDWRQGTGALRYCHYADDDEHAALVAATGMTEIETYRADGEDGAMNRYSVLRKVES